MKTITKEELAKKIELHQKWLKKEEGGERLVLGRYDLRRSDLRRCDLRGSSLIDSDLRGSKLSEGNLSGSDFGGSDFRGCDLSYSSLRGCNLSYCDLRYCDLSDSDLSCSYMAHSKLRRSNLSGSNLGDSNLSYSNLQDCRFDTCTSFFQLQCPEEGAFIAWKYCSGYIVKLLVTESAERSSATSRLCRCSEAMVLEIQHLDGTDSGLNEVHSDYCNDLVYRKGEITRADYFCKNRWERIMSGIHFFITRAEAVQWGAS